MWLYGKRFNIYDVVVHRVHILSTMDKWSTERDMPLSLFLLKRIADAAGCSIDVIYCVGV